LLEEKGIDESSGADGDHENGPNGDHSCLVVVVGADSF